MKNSLAIGCDHRGLALKHKIASWILPPANSRFGVSLINDVGTHDSNKMDYPDVVKIFSNTIKKRTHGILICGSGFGMSIAANRHKHIRTAVCRSVKEVKIARQHNNINVLCIGADFTSFWRAKGLIRAFFLTDFEGGRHKKRLQKLSF